MKNDSNQTFEQMNRVALGWLADRSPHEIANNAGIIYDAEKQLFSFSSMGIDLTLTYPDYRITPQVGGWHYLLILHYLNLADGTPLMGQEISFSQMNAGMVRGGGIDRKFETAIRAIRNFSIENLDQNCGRIGGKRIQTNADMTYHIPFLPLLPVTVKVWLPDEEFPASGRLLLDRSADHYFTIEDAVMMAEMLIERIAVPIEQHSFANQ